MEDPSTAAIREKLFALRDEKYASFTAKLIPNVPAESVLGVRLPALRKLAKELAPLPETENFLSALPHLYHEENTLHALIVERDKDLPDLIEKIDAFLPFVSNWATCDSLHPVLFKKRFPEALPHIRRWLASEDVYAVRFAVGMLMTNGLHEHFRPEFNELVAGIRSGEYYINMMRAWYFATALAFRWEETLPYLREKRLDPWTHGKTIQKAIESYRVSDAHKQILRSLRLSPAAKTSARGGKALDVAAAVVRREGKVLICRRPEGKARAGQWEFPGGKLEPGETAEEALVRECREELGFTVRPEEKLAEIVHRYPDVTVRLIVFLCSAEGEPAALEHSALRFVGPGELSAFELCPADRKAAEKLQAAEARKGRKV